jgi:hypothetical protein
VHPYSLHFADRDSVLRSPIPEAGNFYRRQDCPDFFLLNDAVYIMQAEWLQHYRTFISDETVGFEMPEERSLDNDTEGVFRRFELSRSHRAPLVATEVISTHAPNHKAQFKDLNMNPCDSSSERDHPDAVSSQTMKQNGRSDALHSGGERFMAKASSLVAALFVMSLAVCGCNSLTSINFPDASNGCNVSIGQTQGIISHHCSGYCSTPGLVTLPDGNLLTAYEQNIRITTHLSIDGGATWGLGSTVYTVANPYITEGYPNVTLLPNGTLFLGFSPVLPPWNGVPTYMIGTIGAGDVITWSAPVSISTPRWTAGCWASPVVNLANGNLLWPVWCYNNKRKQASSSTVMLSTDGGLTWPTQVTVGNGDNGYDYDESAAVVYPNGDIVMIMRHTDPGATDQYGSYWRSKSNDGGNTWSTPIPVVDNVLVGRPTLALLPSGGLVLLGRAQIAGVSTTGFGTSWDEGLTFTRFTDLGVGGPGTGVDDYDAMSLLPDGSIAVVTAHGTPSTNIDYRNLVDLCTSPLGPSK